MVVFRLKLVQRCFRVVLPLSIEPIYVCIYFHLLICLFVYFDFKCSSKTWSICRYICSIVYLYTLYCCIFAAYLIEAVFYFIVSSVQFPTTNLFTDKQMQHFLLLLLLFARRIIYFKFASLLAFFFFDDYLCICVDANLRISS